MHRSTWKENDQSSRRGAKRFRKFLVQDLTAENVAYVPFTTTRHVN